MTKSGDVVVDTGNSPNAKLRPVPISQITVGDGFWRHWREVVRNVSLERQIDHCRATGRIDNLRRASGRAQTPNYQGIFFNDSDVYKLLEAACFGLIEGVSDSVSEWIDSVIDEIAAAQRDDGYINSYFSLERAEMRYTDLCNLHELYCMGHLIQAAIAHRRATGSDRLFDVAVRAADHICQVFGPGRLELTDGHEEVELALAELARETGDQKYLEQTLFFLEMRGQTPSRMNGEPRYRDRAYYQDHLPVRDQREAWGHAVRLTYLASAMTDIALEREDAGMQEASINLWENAYGRKAYLTGALGARYDGEAFGAEFELPNERAYAETCAAIGGVFWSFRLLSLTGDARYADAIETQLFNSIVSGLAHDGASYFYMNPLSSRGEYKRDEWFACSCCPPNVARLLLSLPGYCYSTSDDGLWVHQFLAGTVAAGGFALEVETDYPWSGKVAITIRNAPAAPASLRVRIPNWAAGASARLGGKELAVDPGEYLKLDRSFQVGERIELELPMPVRTVHANLRISDNIGRVALARGPLVYCLEMNNSDAIHAYDLAIAKDPQPTAEYSESLVGGSVIVRARGAQLAPLSSLDASLYGDSPAEREAIAARELVAIPYFAWGNRGPSSMQVWIPQLQNGL